MTTLLHVIGQQYCSVDLRFVHPQKKLLVLEPAYFEMSVGLEICVTCNAVRIS